MRKLILLACALGLCIALVGPAHSVEALENESALRAQADAAMDKVGTGDLEGAIRDLSKSWPLPASEMETMIGQAKLQQPTMTGRFGEVLGREFIREERAGESFVRRIYIQRFERHAMRWIVTYYRNADGWVVNSVVFDDNLVGLFSPRN